MAKVRFLLFGLLIILPAGCAINDKGLVSARYFENESCYLLTQESWGGYLSTRQTDAGLTLGHTKRIMLYPKQGSKSDFAINKQLVQSIGSNFDKEIDAKDVDLKGVQPYAWIEKNQGIIFHANSLKTGFSAGTESRDVIRLPEEFDGIFMFGYRDNGTTEAVINETQKTK
jgi:hypothetical protein